MKSKEVLNLLKISRVTLCSYVKSGKITATLLSNGYYDYDEKSVFKFLKKDTRINIIYGRVSTSKQKGDLKRQVDLLIAYCKKNKINYDIVYSDINSGLDMDRKNFAELMEQVFNYKIKTIYVTYKDRLTRLSFKTLENVFKKFGTSIVCIGENTKNKDNDKELFDELISLIHHFSTQTYSKRHKTKLSLTKQDLEIF